MFRLLKSYHSVTIRSNIRPVRGMSTKTISLTAQEALFRQFLLDSRAQMTGVPGMKNLELRWTGGWVRDKLLGVTSHDIDVALSTMTGEQFGQALKAYASEHGTQYEEQAKKQGFSAEFKDLHKIKANPEKSKNLETITTRMFGIDVDFVNLRKEIYNDTSRNPQMEFGTPEEDALRRDACVNALFYNLDTQAVEDFTGRGLQDMEAKIIRTPLEPYQTFKDDPLRVLRLIRFAARLGYTIQEDTLKAMANEEIHAALRLKISRERVGVEIGKVMTGPDAFGGLMMVYNLNLYATVFADPNNDTEFDDRDQFPAALDALRKILDESALLSVALRPRDDLTIAWTLATYVPYRDDEAAAVTAARESIKATNTVSKVLSDSIRNRAAIQSTTQHIEDGVATRAQVGMVLRDCGKSWRFQVLYSFLCNALDAGFDNAEYYYTKFVQFVQEQGLENAAEMKPILNGNDIRKHLEISQAGSWLKTALEMVVEWQLANPKGTAAEATKMLKQRRNELPIG